jgi:hypothetical protein
MADGARGRGAEDFCHLELADVQDGAGSRRRGLIKATARAPQVQVHTAPQSLMTLRPTLRCEVGLDAKCFF